MNILHVVQLYHPVQTGAARLLAAIGERLVRDGHRVTVLATDAYDLEHLWAAGHRRVEQPQETHNGVQIVRLPIWRAPGPPIVYPVLRRLMVELSRLPGSAPLLRRLASLTPRMVGLTDFLRSSGPYDAVHAANVTLDFAVIPALAYARRVGARFLCTPLLHLGTPGDRSIARYYTMRHQLELLRQSAAVLTMTEIESAYLRGQGVRPARLIRTGAGVEPAELAGGDGARFRAEQRIDGPLILYIGALARDKGAIDTVEAARRLWAQGSAATLALIGAPLSHFTEYLAALPAAVTSRIRVLPYAAEPVKRDALAAAQVFTLPSRTDSFGIVFLEAWCYGLPVVGAAAGGIPGVIAAGVDGELVPYGQPEALAAALGGLLGDQARARRFGAAGQAKVLREYTWEQVYARARPAYALRPEHEPV